MRPIPILLAATLLIAGLASDVIAVDPTETPPPASNATPPASETDPASAEGTPETAPVTPSAPAAEPPPEPAAATVAEVAPDSPNPSTPPTPQVITAQIDPELALRLSLLEKTMLAQTQGQTAIYTETSRLLMFFGSACVAMGLIAMVAAVFLMNRTLASVSAITAQVAHAQTMHALPAPGPSALVPSASGQPPGFEKIQASGQRFQGRMTSLEQRLEELEHLAGQGAAAAPQGTEQMVTETPAEPTAAEPPAPRRVIPVSAILVHKSEALMNLGKLDEAMAALDEAARHDGDPAEIHMARGRVLEKLGRLGDALQSYDLAVNNDRSNTAALLMKAGVLNRQERFDEALDCYERALAVHRSNN